MASALCSPPLTATAQHQIETPDNLLRRLKVLEVESPPSQAAPRLSWEEDPVTWLVHELLYCCQVREQQKFDATYEDVSAMLHKFMNQNQSLETGPVSATTRQAEFAKMLASLIKRVSVRGQIQAVNDFLQEKLEHVVAVLAPHATARPVADLLEAMAQGVSSFRMEHDMQAAMTVLPFVVRYARAMIRAINEGYTAAVSRSEQTFLAQCQLLATSFSTLKDGMRVLLNAQHVPRETIEAMRRAPELPSRLGAPARAQLFKCLLHESAPSLLLAALKLEACGELEYMPSILVDILRHGTRFAAAHITCLQRALGRAGHQEVSEQAQGSETRPGTSSMLHLSRLLAVFRAALHLQQVCCCPAVQWQRLEQLLLHEVRDSAGVASGNLCSLLWDFLRYQARSTMVIQHAMYVLKTCIAQAERLPRVLRQLVEDHRMLEVTAGILQSRLEPASHASSEADLPKGKAEKGLVDLAAFCQGLVPCMLDHGAAISKVAKGAEVQLALDVLEEVQSKLAERKVQWQFDLKSIKSKNHCIAKQVLATLKDSPMVPEQDPLGASEARHAADQMPGDACQQKPVDDLQTDLRSEAKEASQPSRGQSHSRTLSLDAQPAGSRRPGRSRGSERPPAGPPSPAPGRQSTSDVRRSLDRFDRPPGPSRPPSTLERSRSATSLSSKGSVSPAQRPPAPRLSDKDGKSKPQGQISIRVDAQSSRSLLPPASSTSGREMDGHRHRRSRSELSLSELQHSHHARSASESLLPEVCNRRDRNSDAGHLVSSSRLRALINQPGPCPT